MINPAITAALARAAQIRDALTKTAGNAGHFVMDEARGTLANLSPSAVAGRYAAVDQAKADEANSLARSNGFPDAAAVNALHPDIPTTDWFTQALRGAYNTARAIKHKL